LLPVLVPARNAKSLPARLPEVVAEVLSAIGIADAAIRREVAEMSRVVLGRTSDRRVLGSMSDFAFMLKFHLDDGGTLLDAALELAESPCKPIEMQSPRRATVALFAQSLH